MNPESRDTITWALSTLLAACALIALATKMILIPYLREHLIAPMQQVKRQVTDNHHQNEAEPTLPDRIEDVGVKVDRQGKDVKALARVFDEHLNFSDRWVDLIEREIDMIHAEIRKHHPDYKPPHWKEPQE